VLLAYPLAMTFTLVYTGEHYVADVLVGWLYVALTFIVVGLGERWWERRRAALS
jgi:membrane-associated phospholipid phosphatase